MFKAESINIPLPAMELLFVVEDAVATFKVHIQLTWVPARPFEAHH